ncbi:hypothetical protein SEA_A3WALLY_313 [Microbacterium phage A3Wally]|nr:hypothetical protein SEA_A3WALLY_313 [Microbacterium phage A3Wally]
MHGSDQLRAHAKAAVTLSEVLEKQRELGLTIARASQEEKAAYVQDAKNMAVAVQAARAAERKAYLAYTNPFGVVKTV